MANLSANQSPAPSEPIQVPHTISLDFPIQWGKDAEPRLSITVNRRLITKDFKGINTQEIKFDDMMHMASKITGEPLAFIEALDATDFLKITAVIQSFLPSGLTTGESR